MTKDRSSAGGKSFDLGRTLSHVLVWLKEDDVNFGHEHACESDCGADVDADTQRVDLYLQPIIYS